MLTKTVECLILWALEYGADAPLLLTSTPGIAFSCYLDATEKADTLSDDCMQVRTKGIALVGIAGARQ